MLISVRLSGFEKLCRSVAGESVSAQTPQWYFGLESFCGSIRSILAWPENTLLHTVGRGILGVVVVQEELDAPSIHHCAVVVIAAVVVDVLGVHNKLLFRAI